MTSSLTPKDVMVLIASIVGCVIVGVVSGMTAPTSSGYADLDMPPLSPPGILFPIVWTILYILMGSSLWIILRSGGERMFLILFAVQLVLNFVWVPLFFGSDMILVAFVDLVVLWMVVLMLLLISWNIDRRASYLLVPYLIWLTFAGYLNLGAYLLN